VRYHGSLPGAGTVLLAETSSGRWQLTVGGRSAGRVDAFGVANGFVATQPGSAHLRYRTPVLRWVLAVVPFALWAIAVSLLWRTRRRPVPPEPDTQLMPILAGTSA
jgi:hypothetical protein